MEKNGTGKKITDNDSGSKSEARRLILQGGVSIDGDKVVNIEKVIKKSELASGIKIKKGKKVFHRAVMK